MTPGDLKRETTAAMDTVGSQLQHARVANGLTAAQLGKRVGVSAAAIGRYERCAAGQPPAWVLRSLCRTLGVSADAVLAL